MENTKKLVYSGVTLFVFFTLTSFSPTGADAILGIWKEQDGTKTIKIYKVEGHYFGKLTENLSDHENKLQPGTVIMKDFVFEDDVWAGTIEIPTKSLRLKGKIVLENKDQIKSTVTIVFIDKSKTWLRVK